MTWAIFIEDLPYMLSTKFQFIRESGFRGKDFFRNQPIRNRNDLWWPCLLTGREEISNLYRWHSIDASYHVSVHFCQAVSEEKIFKNRPIREKNCLWRPCLSIYRDNMSNLYREPSIDASYQISVHLEKRFQRGRFFRNQPIKNKNGLWRPCLLTDRN
jgi:hypothetical protein